MPFTGRAIYDSGVLPAVWDDISDIITMISPYETPLLHALTEPTNAATSVYHEWLEDSLGPNTIITSTNIASDNVNAAVIGVAGGNAKYLQVGMILRGPDAAGNEYFQISVVAGSTITLTRAFAGTTANSFAAGQSLSIISDAALDGADVTVDTSKSRVRKGNYTQIFKKDVIISGTTRAVSHIGVPDEWDYQIQQRSREILRDLEKAVILGKLSGNTIGTASAVRTFDGILNQIVTNIHSWGTLTDSALTSSFKACWDNGGNPSLILAGDSVKRTIDGFNSTRMNVFQGQSPDQAVFRNIVSVFECTYGAAPVLMARWMPANRYALLSPDRIKVVPLQGRSFAFRQVASAGDSDKGMILGEYTTELHNEEGMLQAKVG